MSTITMNCRTCGSPFVFPSGVAIRECPNCGTSHGRPQSEGTLELDVLCRANTERAALQFDEAVEDYRSVLLRHPDEHEALWGLVLCKYGVEFIIDPRTRERRATLHKRRRQPITEDNDFRLACARAPREMAEQYAADAAYIEQIQRELGRGEATAAPEFEIFLCYKGSAAEGHGYAREHDYARDLYYKLGAEGYRVFFANDTLKHVAGADYEANIFRALQSAKVMLVICSDPANLSTPWVRSEWMRFLRRVDEGEKCRLIPLLYDGCDPYALPAEFQRRNLHALRMDELDSLDNLRVNLQQLVERKAAQHAEAQHAAEELTKALLPLEYQLGNSEWNNAVRTADELITRYPECSQVYVYKLMAKMRATELDELREIIQPFEEEIEWKWALRYANREEKVALANVLTSSREKRQRLQEEKEMRREAERRRVAEEKQAEEDRLAEEERKRQEVRQLLQQRRFREAQELSELLADHKDRALLQLMAKYRVSTEANFSSASPECFNDPLWYAACADATPELEKRMQAGKKLAGMHEKGVQFRKKLLGLLVSVILVALVVLLSVFGLPYLSRALDLGEGVTALIAAVSMYVVFAVAYVRENESGAFGLGCVCLLLAGGAFALYHYVPNAEPVYLIAASAVLLILLVAAWNNLGPCVLGVAPLILWWFVMLAPMAISYFWDSSLLDVILSLASNTWVMLGTCGLSLILTVKAIGDQKSWW